MKAGIHRIILPATLTFALCVAIFVSFVPKQAAALSMAPTANSKDQMVVIQKLLEQVKDLQKQLTDTQQAAGEGSGQSSTCLDIKNNFGYQSSDIFTNNEVSAVQKFLQANGYLNIAPTGYYGPLTTEAVKSFQGASGIEASGYVGTQTRAKIKGITCPPAPIVDYINEDTASSSTDGVINFGDDAKYPPFAVPSVTFTVSSSSIAVGGSSQLSWKTKYANECVFLTADTEERVGDLNGSLVVQPTQTTSYTLVCSNNTGIEKSGPRTVKTVTVEVSSVSPACTLITDKSSYKLGDTIKLTWKGTSGDAEYVVFDTKDSEKDAFLQLHGDKLEKSGTISVEANFIGHPAVILYVYDAEGLIIGSCYTRLPISEVAVNTGNNILFVGGPVKTIYDLNVRETPSLSGAIITVEHAGAFGNVVDGPKDSDGHTWWKVQYESGVTGWSTGKSLEAQTLSL